MSSNARHAGQGGNLSPISARLEFSPEDAIKAASRARTWINATTGEFNGFRMGQEIGIVNADLRNQILRVLLNEGEIEPVGKQHGFYHKVDNKREPLNWQNAQLQEYPLWLPLNLSNMCVTSPGNIMVVAGSTNSGKTGFLLDVIHANLAANKGQHQEIALFNSESGEVETKCRLLNRGRLEEWEGLHVYKRTQDFHRVIYPNGFNVIDFLEVYGEFWEIGTKIAQIHAALDQGVAIVAVQKKTGETYGRGGEFGLEKPRLAVSLNYDPESRVRTCQIIKCKQPRDIDNPQWKECQYTLSYGANLRRDGDWKYVSRKQRQSGSSNFNEVFNGK